MKITKYILPAAWSSMLVNGDESGLTLHEINSVERFTAELPAGHWSIDGEPYFRTMNDANDIAGDVCDFEFTVRESRSVKRTVSELAADYGFGVEQTGGGCTALTKDVDGQAGQELYAMITEIDDPSVPVDSGEVCALSIYDRASDDCEPIISFHVPSVELAMQMADMVHAC